MACFRLHVLSVWAYYVLEKERIFSSNWNYSSFDTKVHENSKLTAAEGQPPILKDLQSENDKISNFHPLKNLESSRKLNTLKEEKVWQLLNFVDKDFSGLSLESSGSKLALKLINFALLSGAWNGKTWAIFSHARQKKT